MRPVPSAGRRARTPALSRSASAEDMAAMLWPMFGDIELIVQNSSKLANVRDTVISRVSTASRPAPAHSLPRTSIRDASALGGNRGWRPIARISARSEEHTSELQSRRDLVCRLLLEKKKKIKTNQMSELRDKRKITK